MPGEKRHITRSRATYSCQRCRQRKVKCDKTHPTCGSCQKTDEECVYASSEPEAKSNHDSHAADTGHGKKRKQTLDDISSGTSNTIREYSGDTDLEDQLVQLSLLLNKFQAANDISSLRPDEGHQPDSTIAARDNRRTWEPRPSSSTVSSTLVDEAENSSNLDTILAQLGTLTESFRLNGQSGTDGQHIYESLADRNLASPQRSQTVTYKHPLHVPDEPQRNALFRSWLSSVYPVLPVMDPSLILLHYRHFHFWYNHGLEKGVSCPCDNFVPFIFAVYYAGMISMSVRGIKKWFPGMKRQELLRSAGKQFFKSLDIPSKLLSEPPVLAARVMMYYLCQPHDAQTSLIYTAAPLIQSAYSCNLHRERPNATFDPRLAECRRRLWWEVMNFDTMQATAGNTPPVINHRYCDVEFPSEIKETKLDRPEAKECETGSEDNSKLGSADDPTSNDRSSLVSSIFLFFKARTALASSSRKLLDIHLAAKQKDKEDMMEIRKTLADTSRYVNSVIDRIPSRGLPEMGFTPQAGRPSQSTAIDHGNGWAEDLLTSELEAICGIIEEPGKWKAPHVQQHRPGVIAFHKFARIVLSMLIDQTHCFSYAPFLRNAKNKLWVSARQCALKNAHSCMRKFNTLATDWELERFRWTWPRNYQPIHACIIILLDTYERPTSREAPRSRALFDQMLLLSSSSHGIVGDDHGITSVRPLQESGDEAFVMLMHLRAKAWHKAGLDPTLLWTEQDQIDVEVAKPLTEIDKAEQSMREDLIYEGELARTQTTGPKSRSTRPVLVPEVGEFFHPSEAGIPDERDEPMVYSKCSEAISTSELNRWQLRRARPDQESVPGMSLGSLDRTQNPKSGGSLYHFELPSGLSNLDDLVRKIKEARTQRQQSRSRDHTELSSDLGRQVALANQDLTTFLAQRFHTIGDAPACGETMSSSSPGEFDTDLSTKSLQHVRPPSDNSISQRPGHNGDLTGDMTIPLNNGSGNSDRSSNRGYQSTFENNKLYSVPAVTQPSLKSISTLSTTQASKHSAQPSISLPPQPSQHRNTINHSTNGAAAPTSTFPFPLTDPSNSMLDPVSDKNKDNDNDNDNGNENENNQNNNSDLLNMDFDWAKWDEIFGHILDTGFENASVDDMVDVWRDNDDNVHSNGV